MSNNVDMSRMGDFIKELAIKFSELIEKDKYRDMFSNDTTWVYTSAFFASWCVDVVHSTYVAQKVEQPRTKVELKNMIMEVLNDIIEPKGEKDAREIPA